jgi:hypothetical protein
MGQANLFHSTYFGPAGPSLGRKIVVEIIKQVYPYQLTEKYNRFITAVISSNINCSC